MTPKEKAIELYDKFHVWDTMNHKEVKTLALIAVDEIMQAVSHFGYLTFYDDFETNKMTHVNDKDTHDYWQEVKQEIEKL